MFMREFERLKMTFIFIFGKHAGFGKSRALDGQIGASAEAVVMDEGRLRGRASFFGSVFALEQR